MLAWVCDLIVASDDAFFQDPVVRMGIPGVEYFAHAQELNPRIAKEFLFLGERMLAERAHQMGMVNRVVPFNLMEAVQATAEQLAQGPVGAYGKTKQAFNKSMYPHLEEILATEADLQEEAGRSIEHRLGVEAFLGKMKSKF